MSFTEFAKSLHQKADALRGTATLLRASAEVVSVEIKRNIDRRQNAGVYRVDDTGTIPGEPMAPLAKYTIADRERRGVFHDHQLKDSGQLYRDIRPYDVTRMRAKAGPSTPRSRRVLRRQLGDHPSSDLKKPIPPRNPIGYREETLKKVRRLWLRAFRVGQSTTARAKLDLRF